MSSKVLVDMAAGRTTFAEAVEEPRTEASGDPAALGALYGIFRIPAPEERPLPAVG
ncbi:hypothetical protein AB0J35_40335 [Nonomuraea angiospora]|uniref:hypothetical protein n=1 Tax=Nonomuraea angiospora TaxID=46172 RepID=UPI0034351F12